MLQFVTMSIPTCKHIEEDRRADIIEASTGPRHGDAGNVTDGKRGVGMPLAAIGVPWSQG